MAFPINVPNVKPQITQVWDYPQTKSTTLEGEKLVGREKAKKKRP